MFTYVSCPYAVVVDNPLSLMCKKGEIALYIVNTIVGPIAYQDLQQPRTSYFLLASYLSPFFNADKSTPLGVVHFLNVD